MTNIPETLRYSKDHEWVLVDGDVAGLECVAWGVGEGWGVPLL